MSTTVRKDQQLGRHVRELRQQRGVTQDVLAARAGLAADTIRRLEYGVFSPSLDTIGKLCAGLDISVTTFFYALDLRELSARELIDLVVAQPDAVQAKVLAVLRELFALLDDIPGS